MTSIQKWVKFFREAGIQDESAATYADNFVNNRMEMSMLMDLTKDYLNDLGIDTLGDVIKVTKHAKKVAEKINSDRILNDSNEERKRAPVQATSNAKRTKIKDDSEDSKIKQETPSPPPPQQRKRKVLKPPIPHDGDSGSSSPEDRKPSSQALKRRLGPPPSSAQTPQASSTVGEGSDSQGGKSSVFKRLGEVEEEVETKKMKKNVFDRLESVTVKKESLDVDSKKTTARVVTTSGPNKTGTVKMTSNSKLVSTTSSSIKKETSAISIGKIKVKEEPKSAFDRLDTKPDITQVPKVSSTNEAVGNSSTSNNPGKSILKQRRVGGLTKSKSTSSIISLKAKETAETEPQIASAGGGGKKRQSLRVSFGENDYRAVSPRQGIKTRLWGGSGVAGSGEAGMGAGDADNSSDEEELSDVKINKRIQAAQVDDLRKTIGKNKKAEESSMKSTVPTAAVSVKSSTPVSKLRVQVNNAKPVPSVTAARKSPETEDPKAGKKVQKKIFIVKKFSDGTQIKEEISPDDPRIKKHSNAEAPKPALIKGEPIKQTVRPNLSSMQSADTRTAGSQVIKTAVSSGSHVIRTAATGLRRSSGESDEDDNKVKRIKTEGERSQSRDIDSRLGKKVTEVSRDLESRLGKKISASNDEDDLFLSRQIHSIARRGLDLHRGTLEARASRISSELDQEDEILALSDRIKREQQVTMIGASDPYRQDAFASGGSVSRMRSTWAEEKSSTISVDSVRSRIGSDRMRSRSEDDDLEKEIAQKEKSIHMLQNRIQSTMRSTTTNNEELDIDFVSSDGVNRRRRSHDDENRYSATLHQDDFSSHDNRARRSESSNSRLLSARREIEGSLDRRRDGGGDVREWRTGGSDELRSRGGGGGTMIADREQHKTTSTIEARLSSRNGVGNVSSGGGGYRDRSRSPATSSRRAENGASRRGKADSASNKPRSIQNRLGARN